MRCFDHPEADAVGVCKQCQRGVCRDCAVLVGDSVACASRCEDRVALLNDIITKAHGRNRAILGANAAIFGVPGLLALGTGLLTGRVELAVVGGFLLLMALVYVTLAGTWRRPAS